MRIDEYLAALARQLRVGRRSKRRILREIETHLLDAAAREEQAGCSRPEAEVRAVSRMGSVQVLAERFSRPPNRKTQLVYGGVAAAILAGAIATALVFAFNPTANKRIASPPTHQPLRAFIRSCGPGCTISRQRIRAKVQSCGPGCTSSRQPGWKVTISGDAGSRATRPGFEVPAELCPRYGRTVNGEMSSYAISGTTTLTSTGRLGGPVEITMYC
jgi:hypothetical protein